MIIGLAVKLHTLSLRGIRRWGPQLSGILYPRNPQEIDIACGVHPLSAETVSSDRGIELLYKIINVNIQS